MTSSTSNSEPAKGSEHSGIRRELPVLLMVTVVLLATEAAMRLAGHRLSRDMVQISAIPAIADELSHATPELPHILFLGNSLIREGVDVNTVEEKLNSTYEIPSVVRRVTADATGIPEWYYTFKQFFANPVHAPDVLILGFEGDGGGHLSDQRRVFPDRLGHNFCRIEDLPEVFTHDITAFDQRMDFIAASVFWTYANRDRVQKRVLDKLIPGYRDAARHMNEMKPISTRSLVDASAPKSGPQFSRLQRLIELATEHDVQLIFLAMPVPREYAIAPELQSLAAANGIPLIDGRQSPGIDSGMFPDGYHMNHAAASMFSQFLAGELASSGVTLAAKSPRQQSGIRLVGHQESDDREVRQASKSQDQN